VREVTQKAIAARHVLAEDLDAILDRAGRLWDLVHSWRTSASNAKSDSRGAGL
jgi:hypothetical protein